MSNLPAPVAGDPRWLLPNSNVLNTESNAIGYIAYVQDANGCIKSTLIPIIIPLDPTPAISVALADQCVVQNAFGINVTLTTAGVGPYNVIVNGQLPGTSVTTFPYTISSLASGSYTVQVLDSNGCGAPASSLTILTPLSSTAVATSLTSCANNDGVITVTTTGGSGSANYVYTVSPTVGTWALNVLSGVPSGSYIVTTTDTVTGCKTTANVTLTPATEVKFTTTQNDVSCNGGNTGTITVNLTAGFTDNPAYTYAIISGPSTVAANASNTFTGLVAGTYEIQVRSGRNCVNNPTVFVTISQPDPIKITVVPTVTPFGCSGNSQVNNATIVVTGVIGGTGTYNYNFVGPDSQNGPSNTLNSVSIAGGTYIITVSDQNGCTATTTATIPAFVPMSNPLVGQTTAITCANTGEVVSLSVTGGSGNFTYQLLSAPFTNNATNNSFTLTAPGSYIFQINDTTTGCTIVTNAYVVPAFNTIAASATTATNVSCFGGTNGSVSLNVSGYTGAYTYSIKDPANALAVLPTNQPGNTTTNPLVISNLAAGTYTITVIETAPPLCTITTTPFTIGAPATALGLTLVSNTNAYCNSGAIINVQGVDGTPGYTYAFVASGNVPTLGQYSASNISAPLAITTPSWDVYVKDANGCITFITVPIVEDPLPTVTVPALAANQCNSANGLYSFTATGTGVGILTYTISPGGLGGFQGPTFNDLPPASYVVTIKDGNGCTATSATFVIYDPLTTSSSNTLVPSCTTNDGQITVASSGGSGTVTYTISPTAPSITFASPVFSGVPAGGPYTITALDSITRCSATSTVTLPVPIEVTYTTTVKDVTCNLGTNGSITVNLDAGNNNPIYQYQITAPPLYATSLQTSNVFNNLPQGSYTINVVSGSRCSLITAPVVVNQPVGISVSASVKQFGCNANTNATNNAVIRVFATGGSGTYLNYQFSQNGNPIPNTGNVLTVADLLGGSYTVIVTDSKGCTGTLTLPVVVLPFKSIDTVKVNVTEPNTCAVLTQTINVLTTHTGGTPANLEYTVVATSVGNTYSQSQTNNSVFTGLGIGSYLVTVKNLDTGCSLTQNHFVNEPNIFSTVITNISDAVCFGGTGSATIGMVIPFPFPIPAPPAPQNVGPFSYTLTAINTIAPIIRSGNSSGTGTVNVTNLPAGTYTVNTTLRNTPFCSTTYNFTISQPSAPLTLSEKHTQITCTSPLFNDGTISVSASGGWPGDYQYQLVPGNPNYVSLSDLATSALTAGTYIVNVRDTKGCKAFVTVVLTNPVQISATVTPTILKVPCKGDTTACINVTNTAGGSGSYYYLLNQIDPAYPVYLNGPNTTGSFCNLGAGTYNVTVSDTWGCSTTIKPDVVITEPTIVTAGFVIQTNPTCAPNSAQIKLTATGGTLPYFYSSTTSTGTYTLLTQNNIANVFNVGSGNFTYYVKDSNNCAIASASISITPVLPLKISVNSTLSIISCNNGTTSLTASATGGLGNYIFTLIPASGGVSQTILGTQVTFNNVPAGTYTVNVKSGVDCSDTSVSFTIINPPAVVITRASTNVTCNSFSNGTITVVGTGGTGLIQYSISGGPVGSGINPLAVVDSGFFKNLPPGDYVVLVKDGNACPQPPQLFTITEPNTMSLLTPQGYNAPACIDDIGTLTFQMAGGTTTGGSVTPANGYTATLVGSNPPVTQSSLTGFFNFNLVSGLNTINVTDDNGCGPFQVTQQVIPGVDIKPNYDISYNCAGPDLAATPTVTAVTNPALANSPGTFTYQLDGVGVVQTSPVFSDPLTLTPGTHYIKITHTILGTPNLVCSRDTKPFVISAFTPLSLTLSLSQGLNEFVISASGGSPAYTYTVNGQNIGSQTTYIVNQTGNYIVDVTDTISGCITSRPIFMTFLDIVIPNFFTPNGTGTNETWTPLYIDNLPNITTEIYDRYSRLLRTLKRGQSWDGRYNGSELPSGDYWYVIKLNQTNDDREFIGNFTLYR